MGKFIDLTGKNFGLWTVIKEDGKDRDGKITWLCECKCGTMKTVSGKSLRSGKSKSCGCFDHDRGTPKHKMTHAPEYRIWKAMRTRCNNQNAENYLHYGGRGVRVCERWNDFSAFYEDMGEKPSPDHSIDRINVDGDYEPGNCRWVLQSEQVKNTRIRQDNKSGERGVFQNRNGGWCAYITSDGTRVHLGTFGSKEMATEAREHAEIKYWGKVT